MRSSWHNWFLRCVALLVFISSGALARAMVGEIETHLRPIERPSKEPKLQALNLETRQPSPVQLDGTTPALQPVPIEIRQSQIIRLWLEIRGVAVLVLAFDALAPPKSIS